MLKDDQEAANCVQIILTTTDKDVKLKNFVKLVQYTFKIQKELFVAIRDISKDRLTHGPEEVAAIKQAVESLIAGVNKCSSLFEEILNNEYKVN